MKGMGSDALRDGFFRQVLRLLKKERIPFLIGGGYAFAVYTNIRRDTKDLDLFIRPGDLEQALALAREQGLRTWVKSPHWLGKIARGEYFVDLIFSSGNGICPVDDRWFEYSPSSTLLGHKVDLVPAEEMIWSKAFIMERHRFDGADVAHILLARAPDLDWDRLIERFDEKWAVLLAHLLLFRFVYPQRARQIPDEVLARLSARQPETARSAPIESGQALCRGTLLSYLEYLPDVRSWGFLDSRLRPRGSMSQREIDRWTEEPKN
jgi:hypothetical protein